jgi:hypothetical protein
MLRRALTVVAPALAGRFRKEKGADAGGCATTTEQSLGSVDRELAGDVAATSGSS